MPARPSRVCTHPGCQALTLTGRCEKHPAKAWARAEPTKRIRGRKLQTLRAELFERQPLCEPCQAKGKVTIATIRDHRIPLAEGGTDDRENEQAICEACHEAKSQEEAKRGIHRFHRDRGGI
jgi:5-methylcytosine-specific restriction protein A